MTALPHLVASGGAGGDKTWAKAARTHCWCGCGRRSTANYGHWSGACNSQGIETGLALDDMDVLEFNEAFAAQALACTRDLGIADDDERINPNGGAIALGHPLGMSGARLITTAVNELERIDGKYALCTMCIGVGQGIATILSGFSRTTV